MMVNVIGMGYIGLPTALMMASHGVQVVGTDFNQDRIAQLNRHEIVFEEQGLPELFSKAVAEGIRFSEDYQTADVYIVSVPTPYQKQTRKIDPVYVISACQSVLEHCPDDAIIVVESTVSPGTIDRFVRPLLKGRPVHLVHAPERIIPGNMVNELVKNSRTIGADEKETAEKIRSLYATFCEGDIILTDIRTAEMSKVVENTFRDINIAFANELTKICHAANMDVYEVIRIANCHPRVNILTPGPGVGGHCISVDPWFLVGDYPELSPLIHMARDINDGMPAYVYERIRAIMAENGLSDFSKVGLYGLTYKENVDDTRESPTLQLIDVLKNAGEPMPQLYDPYVKRDMFAGQHHSLMSFLESVDMVVILVGHNEIRQNLSLLDSKIVYDTRHICGNGSTYPL